MMNEEELIYTYEELEDLVLKYQELYIKEKNNINKAIEYIENMPYLQEVDEEFENVDGEVYFTYKEWDDTELLDILKGVDKE